MRRSNLETPSVRQPLLLIAAMILVGTLALFSIDFAIGIIIIGVGLIAFGGVIIAYRRLIWDSYAGGFKFSKNPSLWEQMSAPSKLAYKINIFVIWPFVMMIGAVCVAIGFLSSL